MIQDFIKKVGEFHDAFGVERGNVDVEFRYKLFKEEFEEYKDAKTLVDKADAIVDMLYIACGTIDLYEWNVSDFELNPYWVSESKTLIKIELFNEMYRCNQNPIRSFYFNFIEFLIDLANHNDIKEVLPQLFDEVHLSNLSKLDENGKPIINDGILDPSKPIGKILKGKNYFEPRLKEILENGN